MGLTVRPVASSLDRVLIRLAWLGPLAMVALSAWQASLDRDYAISDAGQWRDFGAQFTTDAQRWLQEQNEGRARLYLFVDPQCACTRVTQHRLNKALTNEFGDASLLEVIDIRSPAIASNHALSAVINSLPATPSLLASDGAQLRYVGPAFAGNFCTELAQSVLGVASLQTSAGPPLLNLLERGCYCARD